MTPNVKNLFLLSIKPFHFLVMQVQSASSNTSLLIINPRYNMGWVITATYRPPYARESVPILIVEEDGWKPGPISRGELKISCLHPISNHEPSSPKAVAIPTLLFRSPDSSQRYVQPTYPILHNILLCDFFLSNHTQVKVCIVPTRHYTTLLRIRSSQL
jgi:hypothetical protein